MISKNRAMMAGMIISSLIILGTYYNSTFEDVEANINSEDCIVTEESISKYKDVQEESLEISESNQEESLEISESNQEESLEISESNQEESLEISESNQEESLEISESNQEEVIVQTDIVIDISKFKTDYIRGDVIDTSLIEVKAIYNNGEEKVLEREQYEINSIDTSKCGEQIIIISNNGFKEEIKINIGYITEDVEDYTMYSSTNLNLREGPGTEFNTIGALNLNDEVNVVEKVNNGWVKIVYNGKEYFCSEKYLISEKKQSIVDAFNLEDSIMYFDGNIPQERLEKVIELYSKIPQNVINAIKNDGYTIWVSSSSYYTDGHCGTYYPAGYDWGDKTNKICIYAKSVYAVDISVIHETGHWIDNYLGRKEGWGRTGYYNYSGVTSDQTWVEIYNAEVSLSGYPSWANNCPEEYFAESVWKALTKPSWCQKTLPRTYEYVMNCINRVQ